MRCGICARCTKRRGCRFLQPGTWVLECEMFEGDPQGSFAEPLAERPAEMETQASDESTLAG